MADLPFMFQQSRPRRALIICFGMGTTYRSSLTWDVDTTAIELVPSVKGSFGFFYPNSARFADHHQGRIIIDDGRRFLQRTRARYDVIMIDPPPPPGAAGSSLLYSKEFYALAWERWTPGGHSPGLAAWRPSDLAC